MFRLLGAELWSMRRLPLDFLLFVLVLYAIRQVLEYVWSFLHFAFP